MVNIDRSVLIVKSVSNLKFFMIKNFACQHYYAVTVARVSDSVYTCTEVKDIPPLHHNHQATVRSLATFVGSHFPHFPLLQMSDFVKHSRWHSFIGSTIWLWLWSFHLSGSRSQKLPCLSICSKIYFIIEMKDIWNLDVWIIPCEWKLWPPSLLKNLNSFPGSSIWLRFSAVS